MSNVFWAVFFGSTLGMFTVRLASLVIEDWREKRRHSRVLDMLEALEDSDFEEYEL